MIKAAIFDLGGVLVSSPSSPDVQTYRKEIRLHKEVLGLALGLKKHGIKLAILSNTIPEHAEILKKFNIFDQFDISVLSYEVSLEKPDPRIYELALQKLDELPSETLLVDDKPEYVSAADLLGINGILYKNPKQLNKAVQKLVK